MRRAFVFVLVFACYSPTPPAGAPCMPGLASCPDGQTCIESGAAYACEPVGTQPISDAALALDAAFDASAIDASAIDASAIDASAIDASAIDAPVIDARPIDAPPADGDGDGVPDVNDNCPTVANADQANEDGDRFGDVCDPCPPVADNNPLDSDGDGVADACDPRPMTPGDHIALFEGFGSGVPSTGWTQSGPWTAGSGSISVDVQTGGKANLTRATPGSPNETVSASVQLVAFNGSMDSSAGIVDDYDHMMRHGLYCHLTEWFPAPVTHALVLVDLKNQTYSDDLAITPGHTFILRQRRDAADYSCDAADGSNAANAQGSGIFTAAAPEIGLRVVNAQATYNWIMVVSN